MATVRQCVRSAGTPERGGGEHPPRASTLRVQIPSRDKQRASTPASTFPAPWTGMEACPLLDEAGSASCGEGVWTAEHPAGMPHHHVTSRMAFAGLVWGLECVIEWEMEFLFDTSDTPMDRCQMFERQGRPDASRVLPLVWREARPP